MERIPMKRARQLAFSLMVLLAGSGAAQAQALTELSGLDHFAVNVTEMDRSVEWYQRVFGFSVLKRWNTTTMVGRGNMKVGLFLRPKATAIGDIDQTVAITHVAFLVDGDKFDDALKKVQAMGLKVEGPEDTGIAYSFFLSDPDGHQIEVTTYHPPLPPAPPPKRGP